MSNFRSGFAFPLDIKCQRLSVTAGQPASLLEAGVSRLGGGSGNYISPIVWRFLYSQVCPLQLSGVVEFCLFAQGAVQLLPSWCQRVFVFHCGTWASVHGCVQKAAVVAAGWCGHFGGSDIEKLSLKSLHITSNNCQSKRICNCCKRC